MPNIVFKNLVGQDKVKNILNTTFQNDTLGHAYLFTGPAGLGKFQAALEFAMALLCSDNNERPCYKCSSCKQILNHSHPNFELAIPITLEKKHKKQHQGKVSLTEEGWKYLHEQCCELLKSPYDDLQLTGIPSIPVDIMREINHVIQRGAIDSRMNVAIISDIDFMNEASSNAMLKTLEEPPENTVIILTSDNPHTVLPTITSRCQIVRFGQVPENLIKDHIINKFSLSENDPRIKPILRSCENSVGRARKLLEQSINEIFEISNKLLNMCIDTKWNDIASYLDVLLADFLNKGKDYNKFEKIIVYAGYIIREATEIYDGDSKNYIKDDFSNNPLSKIHIDVNKASKLLAVCQEAINSVKARGNMHLVLVTWMISIMEILNVKKF